MRRFLLYLLVVLCVGGALVYWLALGWLAWRAVRWLGRALSVVGPDGP
jgi:hypothetical protein